MQDNRVPEWVKSVVYYCLLLYFPQKTVTKMHEERDKN